MSENSKIEWTDATWNPVRGCTKISPGCKNCYAATFAERWRGIKGHPYEQGFDLRLVPDKLGEPLKWKKPKRIFVNSMSDLFHKDVPDEFIDQVFGVMAMCPQHTFQILTKRPERMVEYMLASVAESGRWDTMLSDCDFPFPDVSDALYKIGYDRLCEEVELSNVWLGVSVENQDYTFRIDHLRQVPASVRLLSLEPLLGPLDNLDLTGIDWVIVGGESGPGARPCRVEWIRSIVKQCRAVGVACFVKQLGGNIEAYDAIDPLDQFPNGTDFRQGSGDCARILLHDRKGGDPLEWPEDLRVRQFPKLVRAK